MKYEFFEVYLEEIRDQALKNKAWLCVACLISSPRMKAVI